MYTLVIITAKTCGHCLSFKEKYYNDFVDKAKKRDICIVHIDLPNMKVEENFSSPQIKTFIKVIKGNLSIDGNSVVKKYISWFPMFLLIPTEILKDNKFSLKGFIYNGSFDKNKIEMSKTPKNVNDNNLDDWIRESIKTPPQNLLNFSINTGEPAGTSGSFAVTSGSSISSIQPGFLTPTKVKFKITGLPTE